jgi:HEPN domain-containing protein
MQEHKLWLSYAENDLKLAKISLREDAVISSAFFLTQQCAEKGLKAFLIFHKKPVRKIHDLIELLKDCIKIDPSFEKIKKEAIGLNPFVVTYRYPDAALPFPDKTTLEICIKEAESVFEFVKNRI